LDFDPCLDWFTILDYPLNKHLLLDLTPVSCVWIVTLRQLSENVNHFIVHHKLLYHENWFKNNIFSLMDMMDRYYGNILISGCN